MQAERRTNLGTLEPRYGATRASVLCALRYRNALAWRRAVDTALLPLKITTAEWLVLQATRELIRRTRDAVSQNDVAVSAGVDRTTISKVMKVLERQGLVSRGPDLSARGYRIWLHKKGEQWVRLGSTLVEAVSVKWLDPFDPLGVRR